MVTFFPHKKEQGHCFKIHGQERYLQGGLLLWTGDTLGSNCVSCFKEGVGGALRICRHCMGTKEETGRKVISFCLLMIMKPNKRNFKSNLVQIILTWTWHFNCNWSWMLYILYVNSKLSEDWWLVLCHFRIALLPHENKLFFFLSVSSRRISSKKPDRSLAISVEWLRIQTMHLRFVMPFQLHMELMGSVSWTGLPTSMCASVFLKTSCTFSLRELCLMRPSVFWRADWWKTKLDP